MKSFLPLLKREPQLLLFGFMMMFFTSPGQTYFIALFSGEIREDLSLSHGQFGAIYSAATLLSAFVLLWSGTLIDRIGLRRIAMTILYLLATACLVLANSHNLVILFIAIFLLRHLGQGLLSMTASTAMMRYFYEGKAKANSIAGMGYSMAEALLPSLIILLLTLVAWRSAWIIISVLMATFVPLIIFTLLRSHPSRHAQYLSNQDKESKRYTMGTSGSAQRQWTRAEVIRDPLFYLFVPGILSQALLYTGFMFHQIHMVDEKGWPLLYWGSLYAVFSITAIIANLSIGAWADRTGAIRLAPFITLPMAIGLLFLASSNNIIVAAIFMLLMGISTGAQGALVAPFFAERYGNKYFASIKSLGTFFMVLMSAVSPVAMGWFIDRGASIDQLAVGGAAYAAIAILLALIAQRRLHAQR